MKRLYSVGKVVLGLLLVVSVFGCTTNYTDSAAFKKIYPTAENSPRFTDEDSVNAVLQFSSWDYTFLVRPQYARDGYLQQVNGRNLAGVLNRLHVRRGTAAVVVGWTYNGDTLTGVVSDWKKILSDCGFQRVVVLRAQLGNKLNGSVVVDDSILHVGSVQSPTRGG